MAGTGAEHASDPVARATEPLEAAEVPYEVVEHEPTYRAEDDARAGGFDAAATAKTLVLVDHEEIRLAVIPANRRLDLDRTRRALGAGRHLRLASEAEIADAFPAFQVGALPPFVAERVPEVVDVHLLYRDRVLCGAGDHRHGLVLDPRDLVRLAQPRVADVCEHTPGEHRFADLPRP
jgi:prolyl-tRNA editing enzyme YbaK/EbsC (Cys-tRNA(Pro) deacylase)